MNRVKDYAGFAAWLLGVGYLVLWLLSAPQDCTLPLLRYLCALPHPLTLPLGLQFFGCVSAVWVGVRLTVLALARWRRARFLRAGSAPALAARIPSVALRTPHRKKAVPLRTVKPRSHFGLRGMPR